MVSLSWSLARGFSKSIHEQSAASLVIVVLLLLVCSHGSRNGYGYTRPVCFSHVIWMPGMRTLTVRLGLATLACALAIPRSSSAQIETDRRSVTADPNHGVIDGPPAPIAPAVITRDDRGNATVRAIRLTALLSLDGQLDEPVYRDVPAITGFIQTLPEEGSPVTERTEAWITFDDDNIYVSARLWESAPPSEWVANEMRRDASQIRNNDTFGASFDTYYDRRNGNNFFTNPLGARADVQHMNEGSANVDWNPIWDVRTGRFDGGWSVEMQIPFKSLRYRRGARQIWGVQLRRSIRRKNEWAHLTLVPQSAVRGSSGATAIIRVSRHGTLVGLEAPEASRNIEVKPYGISGIRTDRASVPPVTSDGFADVGLDIKYGVTENLSADITFNTDFAQVEVDEQQVNLTRFQLFFPEKRDFFLEGRGVYDFAAATFTAGASSRNTPTLFFSRRIGLEDGELVPILAGARLTGKVGPVSLGALSIQTGEKRAADVESTNFTVLRVRQDLLRRSSVGALFASRSASTVAEGSNHTFGVDGTFSFFQDLYLAAYYVETRTSGLSGDDQSYLGRVSYSPDLWGVALEHLNVGHNFNPEIGFVRQRGFRETTTSARYSPRPASIEAIRRFSLEGNLSYLKLLERRVLGSRTADARFQIEFESSDVFGLSFTDNYELLEEGFSINEGVTVPTGGYSFRDIEASLSLGLHRRFAGNIAVRRGSFYDGDRTTMAFSGGRLNVSEQLALEPSVSLNWVDLPQGSFQTNVALTRVYYALSPRMFLGGLVQYNSGTHSLSTNFRVRWEYRPGSELFVVYTESRDTDVLDRFSELENRGLTVKMSYLLRP